MTDVILTEMILTEIGSGVAQIVSSLGFPIAACIAMAWFIKDNNDKSREQIKEINQTHKEEMIQVTETYREEMSQVKEALNNNTIALQKLCARLGEDVA